MTKVTLTWQEDDEHSKPYNQQVDLLDLSSPDPSGSASDSSSEDWTAPTPTMSLVTTTKTKSDTLVAKLDLVERVVVTVALGECVEQLKVLRSLINVKPRDSWYDLHDYQTHEQRFTLSSPKQKQQFAEEEYEKIPYTDVQRLQKPICFLITTLTKGCTEVREKGACQKILDVLAVVAQEAEDDERVLAENKENILKLAVLKATLDEETKRYEKTTEDSKQVIWSLKDQLDDIFIYGRQELRYLDEWEATRRNQNELVLNLREDVHNDVIVKHLAKIEHENRIHGEIESFIEENTEDLQDGINYWMQHYDDEVERRDDEQINLNMRWEQLTERHKVLAVTYEDHKVAIRSWLEYKDEKRKQEELEQLRIWAATKIQAFWRGTMVRKKLGPYRIKKGKGKKSKGKKDGKKGGGKKKKK